MQSLFLIILTSLIVFTQGLLFRNSLREKGRDNSASKTIVWATYNHPSRVEQVRLFREWLKKRGYPDVAVKIDGANVNPKKTIIQGVAGVAADLVDFGGVNTRQIREMGLLADLEDPVEKKDRDYYPGLYDELFHNGKRIAHSANVSILMYMCNKEALRKTGQTLPPYRWRFEEFEKMGREYVKEANRGEKRQTRFFADKVNRELMRRSLGVSWFNETMTKSALNDPRNVEVLLKIHQWTFEDHIIPSLGEIQSLSTDLVQGFGGAPVQLFHRGNFAMILFGTWVLVSLRELGTPIDLGAVEPPHGGFPTTDIYGRVIAVYSGSPNKKEAGQFIEFLSSESFNRNVIESGDGYPPDPAYLSDPSLLHPATYSNEWLLHEAFAKASMEISQCREYSPFCQLQDYIRKEEDAFYGFMSGVYSAESAAEQMGRQMDNAIQAYLGRRPKLFEPYQAALERQKKIDAVKKAGKKIPLELVDNPVLKRFYLETGRGE